MELMEKFGCILNAISPFLTTFHLKYFSTIMTTTKITDIELLDPFTARKLKHDLDKNEIRGKDMSSIEVWIAESLWREQILGLLRTGYIDIIGVDKECSPLFRQAEFTIEPDL